MGIKGFDIQSQTFDNALEEIVSDYFTPNILSSKNYFLGEIYRKKIIPIDPLNPNSHIKKIPNIQYSLQEPIYEYTIRIEEVHKHIQKPNNYWYQFNRGSLKLLGKKKFQEKVNNNKLIQLHYPKFFILDPNLNDLVGDYQVGDFVWVTFNLLDELDYGYIISKANQSVVQPIPQKSAKDSFELSPESQTLFNNNFQSELSITQKLEPEAKALLDTIAKEESRGDYAVIYGGSRIQDFNDHPDVKIDIKNGPNSGLKSSAAGRYQFIKPTWDRYKKKLSLADFSPENQDLAAWELAKDVYRTKTRGRDLLKDLKTNEQPRLLKIAAVLSPTWTSLPRGVESRQTPDVFLKNYFYFLGRHI